MTCVKDLPHTTVWTKQQKLGPKKRGVLGPDQSEPWQGLCSVHIWVGSDIQAIYRKSLGRHPRSIEILLHYFSPFINAAYR